MKLRLHLDEDDEDDDVYDLNEDRLDGDRRQPSGDARRVRFGRVARTENPHRPGPVAHADEDADDVGKALGMRRRLRAPSDADDDEDGAETSDSSGDGDPWGTLPGPGLAVPVLSAGSRHELLRRVERSCEQRAVAAVVTSAAYQELCETLKAARLDAEGSLTRHSPLPDPALDSAIRRLHKSERSALEDVERELGKYQKKLEEAARVAELQKKREEAARQKAEETRRQKIKEAEERSEAAKAHEEAKVAAEAAKKAAADKYAAAQAEKKKVAEAARAVQAKATEAARIQRKEHVDAANSRMQRLKEFERLSEAILENIDPQVKKLRVEIKREAGACNQISAAPSAIRNVVDKIRNLMQLARGHSDQAFKHTLNVVAKNLTQQARVVLDYKACYPLAYVITMACVQTPELVDPILGYFNRMCVLTIPTWHEKSASADTKEYLMSIGFEEAVGPTKDPNGLEHITEYTKRMTMIAAVLAAVMQTTPWDQSKQPPGLGIGDCWVWLAHLVNDPPNLLTGPIILTILEVAGFELLRHYRSQFHKLLVLISQEVGPRLSKNTRAGAANAAGQLEMFINDYQENRCQLKEPAGRKLEETKISEADEEKTEGSGGYGGYGGNYGGGGYGGRGGRGGGRGRGRGRY